MLSNINKIKQYLVEVKSISPFRIGNGEDEGNGILLYDNYAVINGTTLSGLFRQFLKEHKESEEEYELVFPRIKDKQKESKEKNNDIKQEISKIYFYDAVSKEKIKEEDLVFRNHVSIDEELGNSKENHLFNECHITEGKTFKLFFEVRGLDLKENKYKNLCKQLERFIIEISKGDISIGSKSTFGFGRFNSLQEDKLYFKEYDLSNEKDLHSYLIFNRESLELIKPRILDIQSIHNINEKIKITLQVYCEDGFIIKGQEDIENIDNKDIVFDKSYEEFINGQKIHIIPSSSIKGLVKNYCNKIYKTLGKNIKDIEDIFGSTKENDNKKENTKGRVIFQDCKISNKEITTYNRIQIDRFTGGVVAGSTFKENVDIIPKENPVEFNVIVNKEDKKALALIILTFRDIGLGYLTVGSGNNVGYGRFTGESIMVDGAEYNKLKVEFKDGKLTGDVERMKNVINIFKE